MADSSIKYTAFSIVFFFSITIFLQLGKNEIQPWDEGLYAYRAKSVLEHNAWWDQTEYSIGGLRSSAQAPLTIWAIAEAMKFFEPETALRLFSAFCGSLSLLLIFLIARRLLNEDLSLLIIIGLAITLAWNKYSRQGMTDIPVVTFALVSFYSLLRIMETRKLLSSILFGLLFALSFAAALMSKILVSFLPLLFVFVFVFGRYKSEKKIIVITAVILGLFLALPWHLYMITTYGAEFYRAFFVPHIYSAVEANTQSLGFTYYLNQLIISNPFFIFAIVLLANGIFGFKRLLELIHSQIARYIFIVSYVWFAATLLVFSIATTKLPHYAVYMIIPGLILATFMFEHFKEILRSKRTAWLVFSLLVIAVFWGINDGLRQETKLLLSLQSVSFDSLLLVLIIFGLFLIGILYDREKLGRITNKILPQVSYVFIIILVARLILLNIFVDDSIRGAESVSNILEKEKYNTFVYLFHEYNVSDSLNPQLAWYTEGWNIGRREGKKCINIPMPRTLFNLKAIVRSDSAKDALLVYYIPNNQMLAKADIYEISLRRRILMIRKNYIIFDVYHKPKIIEKSV